MIEIREGFNPEENKISISVKSALIKEYYANFKGMIKNGEGIPKEAEVERAIGEEGGSDIAIITFPVPSDSTFRKVDNNIGAIGINQDKIACFYNAINKFIGSALRKKYRSTEFIILGNDYPLSETQKDVRNAIKAKRNFAILHTFKEYQDSQKIPAKGEKREIEYNQVYINYGTALYADVCILIQQGNMKELRKLVEPMFKLTKWV